MVIRFTGVFRICGYFLCNTRLRILSYPSANLLYGLEVLPNYFFKKRILKAKANSSLVVAVHVICLKWGMEIGDQHLSVKQHRGRKISFPSTCKTQNSGLRSKDEKPRDPISQSSRCNTQEGLLSVAQAGDSDLLGGRAHTEEQIGQAFYMQKNILTAYYIRVTR